MDAYIQVTDHILERLKLPDFSDILKSRQFHLNSLTFEKRALDFTTS